MWDSQLATPVAGVAYLFIVNVTALCPGTIGAQTLNSLRHRKVYNTGNCNIFHWKTENFWILNFSKEKYSSFIQFSYIQYKTKQCLCQKFRKQCNIIKIWYLYRWDIFIPTLLLSHQIVLSQIIYNLGGNGYNIWVVLSFCKARIVTHTLEMKRLQLEQNYLYTALYGMLHRNLCNIYQVSFTFRKYNSRVKAICTLGHSLVNSFNWEK